jgi:hypothetical protein
MRKLGATTSLTLDGVMQAAGAPQEDPTGGFTHGGWSVNYRDDVMGEQVGEAMTLLKHDLLDEYRLWFFPLVLDSGKRLFADGAVPGTNEPATSSTDRSRSKNQPRRSSNGVRDSPTAEQGDEWTRDPCPR